MQKAFGNRALTFLVTTSFLAASIAAAGSLAVGFAGYFAEVWSLPPGLLVSLGLMVVLTVVNFVGISESVVVNVALTAAEFLGLVIIIGIGIWYAAEGSADFSTLTDFTTDGSPVLAVISGVALAFFAMTGFENAANVAEETVEPERVFPRALVAGMATAGVVYVLTAISAALVVGPKALSASDAPLLEVVDAGVLPVSVTVLGTVFAVIAMCAIANTTLVAVVTQSRVLYGMAREDVVPEVFARVHERRHSPYVGLVFSLVVVSALLVIGTVLTETGGLDLVTRLAAVTVVFLLFIYALVIIAALRLRGRDDRDGGFRAATPLLWLGLVGNAVLLGYVVQDDPASLYWVAGLLGIGLALLLVQWAITRRRPAHG